MNSGPSASDVYLRRPRERDRQEFLNAGMRSGRLHARWVTTRFDDAMFDAYLKRSRRKDHACFLVCRVQDDAILGVININQVVRGFFHSGYLGYYGFRPHDGRGYMTSGLRLVMRHAFVEMKLHRLEANVQPRNTASIELVKRCAFRLEGLSKRYLRIAGVWRDHERWAITVEDWRKSSRQRARSKS